MKPCRGLAKWAVRARKPLQFPRSSGSAPRVQPTRNSASCRDRFTFFARSSRQGCIAPRSAGGGTHELFARVRAHLGKGGRGAGVRLSHWRDHERTNPGSRCSDWGHPRGGKCVGLRGDGGASLVLEIAAPRRGSGQFRRCWLGSGGTLRLLRGANLLRAAARGDVGKRRRSSQHFPDGFRQCHCAVRAGRTCLSRVSGETGGAGGFVKREFFAAAVGPSAEAFFFQKFGLSFLTSGFVSLKPERRPPSLFRSRSGAVFRPSFPASQILHVLVFERRAA